MVRKITVFGVILLPKWALMTQTTSSKITTTMETIHIILILAACGFCLIVSIQLIASPLGVIPQECSRRRISYFEILRPRMLLGAQNDARDGYLKGSNTITLVPSSTKSFFLTVSFSISSFLPPISFINLFKSSTSIIKPGIL